MVGSEDGDRSLLELINCLSTALHIYSHFISSHPEPYNSESRGYQMRHDHGVLKIEEIILLWIGSFPKFIFNYSYVVTLGNKNDVIY